jgi:glycosyltransferase 2 family protein
MNKTTKKWLKNALRWGIAVFGIWYVLNNMSWNNRVLVPGPGGWPVATQLADDRVDENATQFPIVQQDGSTRSIARDEILAKVDMARVTVMRDGTPTKFDLLAQRVTSDPYRSHWPYVVAKPRNLWQRYWNIQRGETEVIQPAEIVGNRPSSLPYPLVDRGIGPMLHDANKGLLLGAIFVFPVVFFIVSYRWYLLLGAIQIRMSYWQAFMLNMVGSFYNTFMPGSTGGDLLKAYYASKLTPHRTRAVLSVIVDRVIGLLALVVLGGVMSTIGLFMIDHSDPAWQKCKQIAIGSLAIILGTAVALLIFYTPTLRRVTGLDWIIRRLPMQKHVQQAIVTMEMYKQRPLLVLGVIAITIPVHSTVVVSGTLAGMAFGLPLHPLYYWVVIPVVVLAASIPISPQGVGVMEFFAIVLTKRQGCTVSQAFALTMSIRIVQILWNLTGGIFVLRGGFHAPSDKEKHTMDQDEPDDPNVMRSAAVS